MYHHNILTTKTLTFKKEFKKCPTCGEMMEKHIVCDGARFHVHSYTTDGIHCSCENCEDNHERIHRIEKQSKCEHKWIEDEELKKFWCYTGKKCAKCGMAQKAHIVVRW